VLGASRWTNFMLRPPTPELLDLIVEMSRNQSLCDEFTSNFSEPARQWSRMASAQRIQAWIEEHRSVGPTTAVA
jgi:hypothetical protein